MMTSDEFVARAVGLPWRRWRSDWQGADCYGMLLLYWREVLGVDLGGVPQTDIASGFAAAAGWVECEPCDGAVAFMAFEAGAPTHCGVLLPGDRLLHAQEGRIRPEDGSTRVTRLAAMRRLCPDIRFFRRAEVGPC